MLSGCGVLNNITLTEKPQYDGYTPIAGTGSMLPCLPPTSVIYYQNIDSKTSIREGDIVIYRYNETEHIIHRVIYVDDKLGYLLKGDNNQVSDGFISRDKIIRKGVMVSFG